MIIRTEDNTSVDILKSGSNKKIWFICDTCKCGILQSYRNYIKQSDGHYCRLCRNIHTANRPDVKQRISDTSKLRWEDPEYREKISKSLSIACKKSWDTENGIRRRHNLSKNNPMHNDINIKKQSETSSTTIEELKKICKDNGYIYIDRILGEIGGVRIVLKCKNGHITEKRLDSFRGGHIGCCICDIKTSQAELDIADYIISLGFDIISNDRNIIKPLELDIIIPDKKIAIEYCGLYWHGQIKKEDKKYHLNKLNKCNEQGYRLITIFEDEWVNKPDIVRARLKHILGISDRRIFARKCHVGIISVKDARSFIERYHIQGYTGCSIKLGLFYNFELVAVLTMAKPSLSKGRKDTGITTIYELSRFCSNCMVVGGAGKLLAYFKRNYEWNEIYTFADKRWSDANLYHKIGFDNCRSTSPCYFYFIRGGKIERKHRFIFRKNVLKDILPIFDPVKTEWENMIENGYDRIFDCGHFKLEMFNKTH